jgi:hypothetical protein
MADNIEKREKKNENKRELFKRAGVVKKSGMYIANNSNTH